MRWVKEKSGKSGLQEYTLNDDKGCRLTLKYDSINHIARINCKGHQRLFFIEKEGVMNPKTIFKNEYGFEIGKLTSNRKNGNQQVIELMDKKYHYSFENKPLSEIVIYDEECIRPLVSCSLNINSSGNPDILISKNNEEKEMENECFLLGLSWYLFLPVVKENVVAFAD